MRDNVKYFLPHKKLQALIQTLQTLGFRCVGPQVKDGAIVYDEITSSDQFPWGIRDHQSLGEYRLEKLDEKKAFAFANGPQAIKPLLFKPRETVWRVARNAAGKIEFKPHLAEEQPVAIIAARACDLAAMHIQDKVFLSGKQVDSHYQKRRESLFIVAVQCSYASDNCFCVSAGTGPQIDQHFDLLMTEIEHGFVIESGSKRGGGVIQSLNLGSSNEKQVAYANQAVKNAADMQTKRIPLDNRRGLRDLLFANLNHPRWDEVAERCLSCGNCTSVCPTCFCHSEQDKPAMDGQSSEHQREWDSCFSAGHSELSGKPLRDSIRLRYRQWLTHKVGSWFDQFDSSGCVGCGRCLAWCPVGIDITEELAAISGESNIRDGHHE